MVAMKRLPVATLALVMTACSHDSGASRPVAAAPSPRETPVVTFMAVRDHRHLPLGTRLYRLGNGWFICRPGDPLPASLQHRNPDILVAR